MKTEAICKELHDIFNGLKRKKFTKEDIDGIGYENGIYIIFENGEKAHHRCRIVRIGTHSKPNNLIKRLNSHRINSGATVFRNKVGCAILNKNNPKDPDLEKWYTFKSLNKCIKKDKLYNIRKQVSDHIINNMSFVSFRVDKISKEEFGTLYWEAKLISTIAKCNNCCSSDKWLGKKMPNLGNLESAKKSGLWLSKELESEILTPKELEKLKKIINKSI